ncbi:MAG: hypothetical protein PUF32_04330 [Prevotella sp.]|nr:hypothetical protein [Prevotella sp.]
MIDNFLSKDELSELEAFEIKGGGDAPINVQDGCVNNAPGCGSNVPQAGCLNNIKDCGRDLSNRDCNPSPHPDEPYGE